MVRDNSIFGSNKLIVNSNDNDSTSSGCERALALMEGPTSAGSNVNDGQPVLFLDRLSSLSATATKEMGAVTDSDEGTGGNGNGDGGG